MYLYNFHLNDYQLVYAEAEMPVCGLLLMLLRDSKACTHDIYFSFTFG